LLSDLKISNPVLALPDFSPGSDSKSDVGRCVRLALRRTRWWLCSSGCTVMSEVAQLLGSHTMSIVSDLTIPARLVGIEEEAAFTI